MKRKVHLGISKSCEYLGTRCGTDGYHTYNPSMTTCRVCWFHILADVAPWARGFLDDLRDQGKGRKPLPIVRPRATAEPVDSVVEGSSARLGRPFRFERGSEKAVRELLPETAPLFAAIQPVVDDGRTATEPVGIEPGQVMEQPGDAGQVSDEAFWNY